MSTGHIVGTDIYGFVYETKEGVWVGPAFLLHEEIKSVNGFKHVPSTLTGYKKDLRPRDKYGRLYEE